MGKKLIILNCELQTNKKWMMTSPKENEDTMKK